MSDAEYREFAATLKETSLYSVGAYFSDRHPELIDEVIEQSAAIERLGIERYAIEHEMSYSESFQTLLTGLAVRYFNALNSG